MTKRAPIQMEPLTPERWDDLQALFGERGACSGCWCMYWRLLRKEFGKHNKDSLYQMTMSGQVAGLLAYQQGKPVGWCSIGPRQDYQALENSRKFKRLDDKPVWSIVCFFTDRSARKQGLMEAMIRGALSYAKQHGAKIVEAYPTDLMARPEEKRKLSGDDGFMGIASTFKKAGFVEVARPSETKVIMRKTIR